MPDAATGRAHQRRIVLWLSLAQLVSWGSLFYTFTLLMEPVQGEFHLGRAEVSLGFSLALLAEGLCAYPIGRWIDAGHERIVMVGGSALAGAGLFLHSAIHTLVAFYAVWTLLGVAMAATLYAPVFAVVTRRFPADFRRAIITMTFLGGLASTVFIPLSAWLIAQLGWRHALWCLAALQFLCCLPIHAVLLKDAPRPIRQATATDRRGAGSMKPFLASAPFLLLGVFVVLMMAVTAALPAHMVSLLRERGLSEAWVIAVPASMGVIQVVGRGLLFFFERHFDVHLANRVIPCLLPAGIAALLLAPFFQRLGAGWGLAFVLLFVLLYGMGNGMLTIVKGTAIAQYVNREHVASLNGALGIPLALARAAAPLTLGLLWTREAGYRYGLWLMLGSSTIAIVALLMAQRRALRATHDALPV